MTRILAPFEAILQEFGYGECIPMQSVVSSNNNLELQI